MCKKKCEKKGKYARQNGAVSVFLIIILVPCIIFTCLFGDISRVQLSKAEAAGASDLAMYSLLAHYDKDLVENYGLVGSCQDIDKYYPETAEYFTGMMSSSGIEGKGSDTFLNYINSALSDDTSDFLQVDFTKEATVSELPNSAMGENPALIEDGIVEFMKYRGPIELFERILEPFQKKNILDGLSGVDQDKPIIDARREYAEAESKLLQEAFYIYLAIRVYSDSRKTDEIPSIKDYQDKQEHLNWVAEDYKLINQLVTRYYAHTGGLSIVKFPSMSLYDYTGSIQAKNIGQKTVTADKKTIYCIDKKKFDSLLKNIDTTIQQVETSAGNIVSSCSGFGDPTTSGSDVNPVRYCQRVQNSISNGDLNSLNSNGDWLMYRYAELSAALDCEPFPEKEEDDEEETQQVVAVKKNQDEELPYDWREQLNSARSKIESLQNSYFSENANTSYMALVRTYKKTAYGPNDYPGGMDTINKATNRMYEFNDIITVTGGYLDVKNQALLSEGYSKTIGGYNQLIQDEFGTYEERLEEQKKHINTILNGGSFTYDGKSYRCISLSEFKKKAQEYSVKREKWGSTIKSSSSGSDYKKSEEEAYKGEGEDNSEILAKIIAENNGKCIDDLISRTRNIYNDMNNMQRSLRNFKYGNGQITKMDGREAIIAYGQDKMNREFSLSLKENDRVAADYYSALVNPKSPDVYQAPFFNHDENGNNPNLEEDSEFIRYLSEQFHDLPNLQDELDENAKRNEGYKNEAEELKKSALQVDNKYLDGKGGNLARGHEGSPVTAFAAVKGMIDIVSNLISGSGDELRDKIYVAEYIMDMFSYSSFNNEGMHRLAASKEYGEIHYTSKDFIDNGYSYPATAEAWKNPDPKEVSRNKSLTNKMINNTNNQMNLGEVEYILYGNKAIDENLKKSYENIYALRWIVNEVSGFQNFFVSSKNDTANLIGGVADAVMAATSGIIPSALTKAIIITCLAIMESANDVTRLKAGVPVALYKSSDKQWCYAVKKSSKVAVSFGPGEEPYDENGLYYSDYMYITLLSGLMNDSLYSKMLLRTGDLIQANMNLMKKDNKDGFDFSKTKCYFKIDAELKVKPLLIDLPIVNSMNGVDVEGMKNSTGWCTYKVAFSRGYS